MRIFVLLTLATLTTLPALGKSPKIRTMLAYAPRNFSFLNPEYQHPFPSANPYMERCDCCNMRQDHAGASLLPGGPRNVTLNQYHDNFAMVQYYKQLYKEMKRYGSKSEIKYMKKMIKRLKYQY